jgi:hypothetical protein
MVQFFGNNTLAKNSRKTNAGIEAMTKLPPSLGYGVAGLNHE